MTHSSIRSAARFVLFIVPALLVFASCKKKEIPNSGGDRAFQPTEIGRWVEYDVDSVVYDDFNCDTIRTSYKMRYDVADTFRNADSSLSYVVETRLKKNDTDEWSIGKVFYMTPTPSGLQVTMDNLRFLKLVFPIQNGVTWAGNSQIPALDADYQYLNNWTYQYQNYNENYDNGRVKFSETVTVQQRDETLNDPVTMPDAYAERTFSREVYARGIGLVYREFTHWIHDPGVSQSCIKGFGVVMRATNHN